MSDQEDDGRTLDDAIDDVVHSLSHYKGLQEFYDVNSNYKYVEQLPNWRGEAEARVLLGDLKRQKASIIKGKEAAKLLKEAEEELDKALEIYKRPKVNDPVAQAHVLRFKGALRKTQNKLPEAKEFYEQALEIYKKESDEEHEGVTLKLITKVAQAMDRVAWIKQKIAELSSKDNKEEESVKLAFNKFDKDKSGLMSSSEFGYLALELGTFPELTEEEKKEALLQIDNSNDGEYSFDELWAWWVSEKLDALLENAPELAEDDDDV